MSDSTHPHPGAPGTKAEDFPTPMDEAYARLLSDNAELERRFSEVITLLQSRESHISQLQALLSSETQRADAAEARLLELTTGRDSLLASSAATTAAAYSSAGSLATDEALDAELATAAQLDQQISARIATLKQNAERRQVWMRSMVTRLSAEVNKIENCQRIIAGNTESLRREPANSSAVAFGGTASSSGTAAPVPQPTSSLII
ncbi:hypothetical protein H696_01522 [Fonticula alba]|uniref:Uncharacterized protein n=1 Tax=Fonticula alba TaxID=691883 RepID=A0A058ZDT4_FONAL|nr:hypothetical protein H696_01522 [Fonticula alba]KCV72116.1 hypothetical protein H696_01522 [Fonticula alba]|eukprot:XP_009493694.1 hypothetical protein H696_01522 [Fonticula alba]